MIRQLATAVCLSFVVGTDLLAAPATMPATAPTTVPATTQPTIPGLAYQLYQFPRRGVQFWDLHLRPKRLRELLPGFTPAAVGVLPSLEFPDTKPLQNYGKSIQMDIDGELFIERPGDYIFEATADLAWNGRDEVQVELDGKPFLTATRVHPPEHVTRTLTQGWHAIHVRYYQEGDGKGLSLKWQPPEETALLPIPADLYRVSQARIDTAKSTPATLPSQAVYYKVYKSPGFYELPEDEANLLVDLLDGPTNLSEAARRDMNDLVIHAHYDELPYWHQVKLLSGFVRGWYYGDTRRGQVTTRAPYTIAPAVETDYDGWRGQKRHGFRHDVTISGQTYTIFTPASDSPERENGAKALAGLPGKLRILIHTIRVEPYGTANEFNGGGGEIWVRRPNATSLEMMDNTFSHEVGHTLMGNTDCHAAWTAAVGKDLPSTSHYGRLNPGEDFAEFTRLYLSTNGDPAQLESLHRIFPNRARLMDQLLQQINFSW